MFERWQINKKKLSHHTSEQILQLALQGNVLLRGWGVAALFRGIPQVICVRICAPTSFRERVIKERLGSGLRTEPRTLLIHNHFAYKLTGVLMKSRLPSSIPQ